MFDLLVASNTPSTFDKLCKCIKDANATLDHWSVRLVSLPGSREHIYLSDITQKFLNLIDCRNTFTFEQRCNGLDALERLRKFYEITDHMQQSSCMRKVCAFFLKLFGAYGESFFNDTRWAIDSFDAGRKLAEVSSVEYEQLFPHQSIEPIFFWNLRTFTVKM